MEYHEGLEVLPALFLPIGVRVARRPTLLSRLVVILVGDCVDRVKAALVGQLG